MSRLIDAEALKEAIAKNRDIDCNAVCDVLDIIDNAPEVSIDKELAKEARAIADENYQYGYKKGREDAAEVRPTGYWSTLWDVYCVCSVCQGKQIKFSDYCPDCGARMKEIKE